jgi:hypothetical protein
MFEPAIFKNSKGVVDDETLKEDRLQGQKLHDALFALKKQGKVKNPSKGIYVKAQPFRRN